MSGDAPAAPDGAPDDEGIAFQEVQVKPPAERPWPLAATGVRVEPQGDADPGKLPICVAAPALQAAVDWVKPRLRFEAGGVLCGHHGVDDGREFVTVDAFLPAPKAKAGPTHLVFTHEAFAECEQAREALDPELQIVGWCHSHPGYGVFLSDADLFIHTQFFPLPWQVALVIDPKRDELAFFRLVDGRTVTTGFFLLTHD